MGALAGRAYQASRSSQDEHPGALRRGLHAVPQGGRALRQAPPHVGGSTVLRRGFRLRPALGPEFRLPRRLRMAVGRRAEEIHLGTGRLHLRTAVLDPPALQRPCDVRGTADRDLQPHGQGNGLRLVRSDRERARVLNEAWRLCAFGNTSTLSHLTFTLGSSNRLSRLNFSLFTFRHYGFLPYLLLNSDAISEHMWPT